MVSDNIKFKASKQTTQESENFNYKTTKQAWAHMPVLKRRESLQYT